MPRTVVLRRFEWVRRAFLAATLSLVALWAYGQVVRDRSWIDGLCFYIPSPVVAFWCLALLGISVWRGWERAATWSLLLATLPPVFMVALTENHWWTSSLPAAAEGGYRLVHWNVCHGGTGWQNQVQTVRKRGPDVIVLSELPDEATGAEFPGFLYVRCGKMMILARWPVQSSGPLVSGGVLQAYLVTVQMPDRELRLLVGDMTSNIRLPRDPWLQRLMQVARDRKADLIVGDLNAPRRSRALSDSRFDFQHAFDVSGSGWGYTWPVPCPVLAIDQCLAGPRIQPVRYELQSTLLSDHRLQCLDFDWSPEVPEGDNRTTNASQLPKS